MVFASLREGSWELYSASWDGGGDIQRLTTALRLCVARPPRVGELESLHRVLAAARGYYHAHADKAAELAGARVPTATPAAEAAAWVATVRVVLNLDETLTRE